jgi:hypothetical protein
MTRPQLAVTALITLITLVAFSVASAISKTPPGQAAPANTSPPSISGTAAVGNTLQASSGSWSGLNITYSFQWKRCDSSGGSCAAIVGATGSSYLIGSSDAGDTLRVTVTASNKNGSASATSAASGVVPSPSGYTNTTLPAISGTAEAGQKLTVSNGAWSPTSSTYQYAWHRCQNGSCALSPTNADQNSYVVQPGDVGYTIFAEVAPGGNWSESADSKQTATVASSTPPPTSGTVYFDGRAKNMSELYSYETTYGDLSTLQQGQSPKVWDCLCFMQNDISLVSDSRYGKAYKVAVPTGDANPWNWSSTYSKGAGQLSKLRYTAPDYGKWDYYGIAVKVPSWNGPLSDQYFTDIASLGYETIQGDQVAFRLKNNNGVLDYSISQNSGQLTQTSTGWYKGSTAYEQTFMPVTYGQWQDFVIAVKWTADNTGGVQVYARASDGSWPKVFEKLNEPTYAIGTTSYSSWDVAKLQSSTARVLDRIGLYFKEYGGESETVYESGLTNSTDLATAESTLP